MLRWTLAVYVFICCLNTAHAEAADPATLNGKDDGYRGVWYMNQPSATPAAR